MPRWLIAYGRQRGYRCRRRGYPGGTILRNDFEKSIFDVNCRVSRRLDNGVRYDRVSPVVTGTAVSRQDRMDGIWLYLTIGRRFSVALDVSEFEGWGGSLDDETRLDMRFSFSPTDSSSDTLQSIGP